MECEGSRWMLQGKWKGKRGEVWGGGATRGLVKGTQYLWVSLASLIGTITKPWSGHNLFQLLFSLLFSPVPSTVPSTVLPSVLSPVPSPVPHPLSPLFMLFLSSNCPQPHEQELSRILFFILVCRFSIFPSVFLGHVRGLPQVIYVFWLCANFCGKFKAFLNSTP